jgi:hypothetical protein
MNRGSSYDDLLLDFPSPEQVQNDKFIADRHLSSSPQPLDFGRCDLCRNRNTPDG